MELTLPERSEMADPAAPGWRGQLAAIDMGSNSFRLEIGQLEGLRYRRISYLKETVRLGAGLDENGLLTEEAMLRGLACLQRFADRLQGYSPWQVRAVATQTLRDIGCWFLPLPPYSPDLNPIEMAFAKLKALLRKAAARTYDDLWKAFGTVCDLFTEDECLNYFIAAGYKPDWA
jgi:hypothetical protein